MTNPFDDDYLCLKNSGEIKGYTNANQMTTIDDDVNLYEQELERYMQDSLDSTQRSRRNLEESEKIGISTATDLLQQREKLENANKNLEHIDRTSAQTQKNLNNIKSVFGGILNRFSRTSKGEKVENATKTSSENRLENTIGNLQNGGKSGEISTSSLNENCQFQIKGTRWEQMDNEIDENLDAMSANLARLNTLGRSLGVEIEDQNKLLDDIGRKTDKTDVVIRKQDNQMKKLLGYKPSKIGARK